MRWALCSTLPWSKSVYGKWNAYITASSSLCPLCCVLQHGTDLAVNPEKWEDRRRDKPVQQLEWELAQAEEAQAVHEFRQNLDYNLGKVRRPGCDPCCRPGTGQPH